MKVYKKPSTWTTGLTEWDKNIMDTHPYGVQIPRKSLEYFDHITMEYLPANFAEGSYTWKSVFFFFKNEDDAVLFTLRWT